jgi:hypothetical protein
MPTDCSGSRVELLGIEVMGMALQIVLKLLSDVNFMIRKWLAARQRSGHTDSNNATRLSCFAQTPYGQRCKLSVST